MGNANSYDIFPEELENNHIINLDQPLATDYQYQEVFGSEFYEKKNIPVPIITIQNQWAQNISKMACGEFWLVHIINAQDKLQSKFQWLWKWLNYFTEKKALNEWLEFIKIYPSAEYEGSTLQQNLEFHRKKWNITGYAVVKSKEEIMHAMDNQNYIYTGSKTGDWNLVRDTHYYKLRTDWRLVGHITSYFKYDVNGVWGLNSYWPNNWKFFVSWDIFLNNFFTLYSVIDAKWATIYQNYRNSIK